MTKPTDDYLWAESAAPADVADPGGVRGPGFDDNAPWTHDEANFLLRSIGRWLDYLAPNGGVVDWFTDTGNLEDGDIVTVNPPKFWDAPAAGAEVYVGTILKQWGDLNVGTVDMTVCATNGTHFAMVNSDDGILYIFDDKTGTFTEITGIGITSVQSMAMTHDAICVIGTSAQKLFDLDGNEFFGGSFPAGMTGLACTAGSSEFLVVSLVAGTPDDYNVDRLIYDIPGGSVIAAGPIFTQETTAINGITTDGVRVFLSGNSSGSVTDTKAIDFDGNLLWEEDITSGIGPKTLATDGDHLWIARNDSVFKVSALTGELLDTWTNAATTASAIAVDDQRVYVVDNSGTPQGYWSPKTHFEPTLADGQWADVCSSGTQLLQVGPISLGGINGESIVVSNRPKRFKYRDLKAGSLADLGAIVNENSPFHSV